MVRSLRSRGRGRRVTGAGVTWMGLAWRGGDQQTNRPQAGLMICLDSPYCNVGFTQSNGNRNVISLLMDTGVEWKLPQCNAFYGL